MKKSILAVSLCLLCGSVLAFAGPQNAYLAGVRKVYIAPMPNGLDQYIRAEIFHQMPNRIQVVTNKSAADAILTGTDTQKKGAARFLDHYTGAADTASAAVSLVSADGSTVLWSTSAGDRSIWWGAMARGGQRKLAERIVKHLKKSLGK